MVYRDFNHFWLEDIEYFSVFWLINMEWMIEVLLWPAQVYSPSKIDIEKPEYASPIHQVYITQPVSATAESVRATLTVPIHLRYHRPSAGGVSADVLLQEQQSYIWCQGNTFQSTILPCITLRKCWLLWLTGDLNKQYENKPFYHFSHPSQIIFQTKPES